MNAFTKDGEWIHRHFWESSEGVLADIPSGEEIVDQYAGRYVAVANEELFVGDTMKEARDKALRKYPHINPSILRVPRPQDFVCAV